jgi:ribosomal protein L12E/L44/L45/RPP1/RPP2
MASRFQKPSSRVFRSYVYLNGDEVLNALSALEGGDIDEVLTRMGEEGGGEVGGELDLKVAKGRAGKRRARRYEEEIRKKRTEHSATTALLKRLHDEDAIGVLEGDYDEGVYRELEEHMLIQLVAELHIHPLHQVIAAAREFAQAAATFGVPRADVAQVNQVATMLEGLTKGGKSETNAVLAYARGAATPSEYRLVLPVPTRNLLVPLDEFAGRATIVGQVDRILTSGDEMHVVRLLKNAPVLPVEREGLLEALPNLASAFSELGVDMTVDDLVLKAPAVVLKPICIYK